MGWTFFATGLYFFFVAAKVARGARGREADSIVSRELSVKEENLEGSWINLESDRWVEDNVKLKRPWVNSVISKASIYKKLISCILKGFEEGRVVS